MEADFTKFRRYLVREFLWELAQHQPLSPGFASVEHDAVEVLNVTGYDDFQVRVADIDYEIHLTWQKDVPPTIKVLG